MCVKWTAVIFIQLTFLSFSIESAKILGLFTTISKSHLILDEAIMQTLVDRGHNVTIVTTLPLNSANKKYRHILLDVPPPPKELFSGMAKKYKSPLGIVSSILENMDFPMQYTNQSLQDPQMKRLMAEESFDLVVYGYFFNTFQIGVAAHFKCPVVLTYVLKPAKAVNDLVGNPLELTYVPHMLVGNSQPLRFLDRVKNVVTTVMLDIGLSWYLNSRMELYYNYNFPLGKYPPYNEMIKNISLVLSCHHFSNGVVSPNVPGLIEIGGIQVKPTPDPLPQDIKKFLDESKHGVVYFSLGSNARSADMSPDTIEIVYKVLAGLKQRVIWKWEEDKTPGNSPNIFFGKWLPQDDILAHPNVKLFVTHGGHGSVVESEYHGIPMVGMPLFADQFSNMDAVQKAGYGLSLGKDDITAEKFESTIKEVLENPSYRNKVQEFSRLYRDRPMTARDTAAYWLEYVIRHKGAKHMQSPAVHMNFIQYYGIDVFGFLFAIVYVVFKVFKFIFKKIVRLCCGGSKKKNVMDERKKYK